MIFPTKRGHTCERRRRVGILSYKSSCKIELSSMRLHVKLAYRVTSQVTNRVELKSQVSRRVVKSCI
jgi:hypothetical protein